MFNPLFIIESVEYTIPPVGSPIAEKTHMVSACLQHTQKKRTIQTADRFAKH